MTAGIIRTARGYNLNMDDLKLRQRKPMNSQGDMKDKVERVQKPRHQPLIHGHMPSMEGVVQQQAQVVVDAPAIPIADNDEYDPSVADFTGVVIENRTDRPENQVDAETALNTIMGDLEQLRKHDAKGDAKGRRVK